MKKDSIYFSPEVEVLRFHLENGILGTSSPNTLPSVTIDDDDTVITPKPLW